MSDAAPALVDIGLNLTHKSFQSDRDAVVARAQAAGVREMILTGTTGEGSREALALARGYPGVMYATAGVHPHHASEYGPDVEAELRACLESPEVVAVGECGLDFYRNFSPRDVQEEAFRTQLQLAVELQYPVFLHERDAADAFAAILGESIAELPGAVVHCFTGSEAALMRYLELGCLIGITGWVCDERRGLELRELLPKIPLDRLMIETDAPYLLPRDLRPKPKSTRNEPAFLAHVASSIAERLELDLPTLAEATTANARRFFQLPTQTLGTEPA